MKSMLFATLGGMVFLSLMGCASVRSPESAPAAQLTPYFTSTSPESAVAPSPATKTPPPEPTATAEPLTHEVALNETISSIALRYGVSMDAIIAANPEVNPRALKVGTRLIIPGASPVTDLNPSAESLALEVGEVDCLPTPEGGLWCGALIRNPLNQSADGVIVVFTVTDEAGQVSSINVPALLNRIDPGQTLPVMAYFPAPAPQAAGVTAELIAALPLQAGIRQYFNLSLQNERLVIQGRSARASVGIILTGVDDLPAEKPLNLWVAASAYDARGRLLGARRLARELRAEEIKPGEPIEVSLMVYSNFGEINSVRLSAEAFILK